MPTEQAIVYWVGIILIRAGGLALLLVVVAGVLGLAMNYFWRKMKDAYTFKELRKAWVFYQEHKDELEKNNG